MCCFVARSFSRPPQIAGPYNRVSMALWTAFYLLYFVLIALFILLGAHHVSIAIHYQPSRRGDDPLYRFSGSSSCSRFQFRHT